MGFAASAPIPMGSCLLLSTGPFEVQGQQAFEDVVVGEVVGPAVGVEDGVVERLVGNVEPGRALVVEVGEGALLQLPRTLFVAREHTRIANESNLNASSLLDSGGHLRECGVLMGASQFTFTGDPTNID